MKKQIAILVAVSSVLPLSLYGLCDLTKDVRKFLIELMQIKNPYNFINPEDPTNSPLIEEHQKLFDDIYDKARLTKLPEFAKSALALNLFQQGRLALEEQYIKPASRYEEKQKEKFGPQVSIQFGFKPNFFDKKFMNPLQEMVQNDLQSVLGPIKGFAVQDNPKAINAINRYLTGALLWNMEKAINSLEESERHHEPSDPNEIHTLAPLIIKALEQDSQYVTTLKKTLLYKEVTAAGLPQHLTKLNDSLAALAARV